ncbi:Hypothetical predicted protein, partial [Paramuricea clavata]
TLNLVVTAVGEEQSQIKRINGGITQGSALGSLIVCDQDKSATTSYFGRRDERYDPISEVTEIVHDEDGWLITLIDNTRHNIDSILAFTEEEILQMNGKNVRKCSVIDFRKKKTTIIPSTTIGNCPISGVGHRSS